jgi:MtrB/PioB family decaheme-associated outer membrane protein
MRIPRAASLIVLALLVVGEADVASAQTQLGGVNVEGGIEAGGRFYLDSRPSQKDRAKFEEYRDMSPGLFLLGANLRLSRPDESLFGEFGGSKWGFSDQDYYLSFGRLGTWQFDFLWDQTPHVISTTARLLATEPHPGVFVLPTPRPPLPVHNSAPYLDEIAVRWDKALMRFAYSVSPNLDFAAEYARTQKSGSKPMGMAFGSPGANFYEVLQPIDQVVHDFRLRAAFADPLYQIQFGYTLSVFSNDLNRIQADNPCFHNPGVCSTAEQNGPATGQSSLPPSNMAHSLSVAGGMNLPLRTRVNGNLAWGLNLQNDSFLPHTINSALAASTPGLALPHSSLNGLAQTWLVYLSATSRPFDPVTFSAKYRFYDYSDLSQKMTFQNVALNDSAIEPTRIAGRWSFNKQNAELDARTRFLEIFALTTGVAWERWDRNEHREVPISNEYFGKLALDATPTEWLLARIGYTPSFRRINEYNTRAHAEHSVLEDPTSAAALQGQSLLLRKFDEANRDRQKIEGQLQFTFANGFTATPSAAWRFDNYVDSPLGLQNETGWSVGIDLGWTLIDRVTFSGGYTYEQFLQKMRSRSRPVSGTTTLDFHDFDWVSDLGDTVQTAYLGVKAALIPKVLDLRIDSAFSSALGRIETSNPTTPVSGTAAQNATATAKPFPAFQDTLVRVEAQLIYYFLKNWSARLGYAFEKWDKTDFRTDTLNPFMGVSSIWLANDLRNYTAHMMGMTLAYQFR